MKMAFLSLLTTHSAMLSSVNQLCLPGQAKILWSPCYSRGPPLVMTGLDKAGPAPPLRSNEEDYGLFAPSQLCLSCHVCILHGMA